MKIFLSIDSEVGICYDKESAEDLAHCTLSEVREGEVAEELIDQLVELVGKVNRIYETLQVAYEQGKKVR